MSRSTISFEEFDRLQGADLVEYLGDDWDLRQVQPGFVDACANRLGSFDEYHLSYAIELGSLHAPERFLPLIAPYLADRRTSVWTAATRAIERAQSLKQAVYQAIERHAKQSPIDLDDWLDEVRAKVEPT